jgi:hypothetical protein
MGFPFEAYGSAGKYRVDLGFGCGGNELSVAPGGIGCHWLGEPTKAEQLLGFYTTPSKCFISLKSLTGIVETPDPRNCSA